MSIYYMIRRKELKEVDRYLIFLWVVTSAEDGSSDRKWEDLENLHIGLFVNAETDGKKNVISGYVSDLFMHYVEKFLNF